MLSKCAGRVAKSTVARCGAVQQRDVGLGSLPPPQEMVAEVNRHLDIVDIAGPFTIHIPVDVAGDIPVEIALDFTICGLSLHRWLLVQSLRVLAKSCPS